MEVYTDNNIHELRNEFKEVVEKIKKLQLENFDPSEKEMRSVLSTILEFIRQRKRKVYGGYALNLLLKDKSEQIYTENDIPDIDFYSPSPLEDLIDLCDILHGKGFLEVIGKEAAHKETYTIFVNYVPYCDITYCPTIVYTNLSFIKVNGLNVTHPHFMLMDFFLMETDLLNSGWRIEKTLPRMRKLLKHYPILEHMTPFRVDKIIDKVHEELVTNLFNFLVDNHEIVLHGLYAYNYFLMKVGKLDGAVMREVSHYEFVTTNYTEITKKVINKLTEITSSISIVERHPLFHFFGKSTSIYYGNTLIVKIFDSTERCIPFIEVKAFVFNNEPVKSTGKIRVGSFPHVALMAMATAIAYKITKEYKKHDNAQVMVSHLFRMREKFFKDNPKHSMYTKSIFQEYIVNCIGVKVNHTIERLRNIDKKRKAGTGPYVFRYIPGSKASREEILKYRFQNSSGNVVRKQA